MEGADRCWSGWETREWETERGSAVATGLDSCDSGGVGRFRNAEGSNCPGWAVKGIRDGRGWHALRWSSRLPPWPAQGEESWEFRRSGTLNFDPSTQEASWLPRLQTEVTRNSQCLEMLRWCLTSQISAPYCKFPHMLTWLKSECVLLWLFPFFPESCVFNPWCLPSMVS